MSQPSSACALGLPSRPWQRSFLGERWRLPASPKRSEEQKVLVLPLDPGRRRRLVPPRREGPGKGEGGIALGGILYL